MVTWFRLQAVVSEVVEGASETAGLRRSPDFYSQP